jgi:tetratricopeptide (TPR) repeat protein
MNIMFRRGFSIVFVSAIFGARIFAADTNSISAQTQPAPTQPAAGTPAQDALNGYLQIQQQLHETQMALEKNREEAATSAQRNADAIAGLEQKIATQHSSEVEAAQHTQQLTLELAGGFGAAGLAVVLLLVYFQWHAVTRFAELSAFVSGNNRAMPVAETVGELAAPGRAAVESANTHLLGVVGRLEKRILELEHTGRAALGTSASPDTHEHKNGKPAVTTDREECIANLIAEGQALLGDNEPEKALECFDVALGLDPKHAEALVKKGGALEKLGRTDEAIACYDRAIEANNTLTIAYLQKGGLFNRMARYDEALQCYEQALHTQEKGTTTTQTAA